LTTGTADPRRPLGPDWGQIGVEHFLIGSRRGVRSFAQRASYGDFCFGADCGFLSGEAQWVVIVGLVDDLGMRKRIPFRGGLL
jgi:hypothetical protein